MQKIILITGYSKVAEGIQEKGGNNYQTNWNGFFIRNSKKILYLKNFV